MTLNEFARNELNRAFPPDERDSMQEHICRDILEIVEVFSKQGHSGLSAAYALKKLHRLLNYKPIAPLTGEDSEWQDIDANIQQNIRCFSVFRKNHDNSTAHDIEGKVFSEDGETWYSNRDSSVPITFPYMPPVEPERVVLK